MRRFYAGNFFFFFLLLPCPAFANCTHRSCNNFASNARGDSTTGATETETYVIFKIKKKKIFISLNFAVGRGVFVIEAATFCTLLFFSLFVINFLSFCCLLYMYITFLLYWPQRGRNRWSLRQLHRFDQFALIVVVVVRLLIWFVVFVIGNHSSLPLFVSFFALHLLPSRVRVCVCTWTLAYALQWLVDLCWTCFVACNRFPKHLVVGIV